ncbi:MAG: SAM-dependent chlorinase/fluorinase [Planctomycetota bacterium]
MVALAPANGIVTLTSDFGSCDPYVAQMKGAVLCAYRRAQLVDVGHDIAPQDLVAARFFVAALRGRFPPGTVHVVVVDPGVGTDRRALAVASGGCYWLAPDNGILSPVLVDQDALALAIDLEALGVVPGSNTFHGRDVFAPLAGRLAGGSMGFRSLGLPVDDAVRAEVAVTSRVVHVDRFGNLLTDVPLRGSDPAPTSVRIAGQPVPFVRCYAEAAPGSLLALRSSFDTLEIAVRDGNAERLLGVGVGVRVDCH